MWTNGGRMKVGEPVSRAVCVSVWQVSVAGYMEFVRASRPNVFESLCDSVSSQNHKLKRVRKSVDRTLRFLDEALSLKQDSQVVPRTPL